MKIGLYFFLLLTTTISPAYADLGTPPSKVTLSNKRGAVIFYHQRHHDLACQSCHHTGKLEKCSLCHGVQPLAPAVKKMFHTLCKDCHAKSEAAPTKCRDCHQK